MARANGKDTHDGAVVSPSGVTFRVHNSEKSSGDMDGSDPHAATRPPNPWDTCSYVARATIGWAATILRAGARKPLEEGDLPALSHCDASARLTDELLGAWAHDKI